MEQTELQLELTAIDNYIAKRKQHIKRGEQLKELLDNEAFKAVILEGYFEEESRKLFKSLTDPSGVKIYSDDEVRLLLKSINHFKGYVGTEDYLGTVLTEAESAPLDIIKNEDYRKEVTAKYAGYGIEDN
jgi:hypothetical protein